MGRFRTEKIIRTEEEANETSSLYILPIDENTFRLIITDDNGDKKVNSLLSGNAKFIQLGDAPITYTDNAGKVVIVNDTEDGLIFEELESLSATIEIGEVTSVDSGEPPQVTNVGTDKNAIFNFEIPVGIAGEVATIEIGEVTSVDSGEPPQVTNVGTDKNAIFNFEIPVGIAGEVATIDVGTVTTLNPEQNAVVTNVGTQNEAVFNFGIPKGEKGDTGEISVITFKVDKNMHLQMQLETNSSLNFQIDENGHLILNN